MSRDVDYGRSNYSVQCTSIVRSLGGETEGRNLCLYTCILFDIWLGGYKTSGSLTMCERDITKSDKRWGV